MSVPSQITGRLISLYFVLFFVTVAVIDGIFVYIAVQSHTGVVTDQAYQKGLAFNQELEKARIIKARNLQEKISYQDGLLTWTVADQAGKPLRGLTATAHIIRPVGEGHDFNAVFSEVAPGIYQASIHPDLPGQWIVQIEAQKGKEWENQPHLARHLFIVP